MVAQSVKVFGAPDGAPGIQVLETSIPNLNTSQGFGASAVFAALKRGPVGVPIPVNSIQEYTELFGKPGDSIWHLFKDSQHMGPDVIDGIFASGGSSRVWITRNATDGKAKKAYVDLKSRTTGEPVLRLIAANEGRWGGYTRRVPSLPVIIATDRTFTLSIPDVHINEFVGAKASFSSGSGAEYEIIANSASNEDTNEVVFTISSQYNLSGDGISGPATISGVSSYARQSQLAGSVEMATTKPLTGTVSADDTVLIGTGTSFNSELSVGGVVYFNDVPRVVTSITSDTTATIDTALPIPVENSAAFNTPNTTLVGTGTAFDTELAVGDEVTVTVDGIDYERTVESIASATELTFTSGIPVEVTVGTAAFTRNFWVEGTTTDFANELAVGDYIVDPNRNGPARKVVEIDTVAVPERFRVEYQFEGGDFSNAQVVKQTIFAAVDLIADDAEGLSVEVGQGIKYPQTHFSLQVYFEGNLVFSAGDLSLDPEDDDFAVTKINEGNIGYQDGKETYQKWLTCELLFNGAYTTSIDNDVRPANGSDYVIAVEENKVFTIENLDASKLAGSLFYPNPYKVARNFNRVSSYTNPIFLEGTVSSLDLIVTGVATEFTESFAVGDYFYNPETQETRKVAQVISDTELVVENAFTTDLPAGSTAVKAGYFSFANIDMTKISSVGDRYISVFLEQMSGGYDGDQNLIPFYFTRHFDLDLNQLEDAVYGKNQGLIRILVPGYSDVTVQKAAANYANERAFEFRAEVPSNIETEALAENYVNNILGRQDSYTIAFPSYGFISSPFGTGKRLIPLTGDIVGMESRKAIDVKGYHYPAAGIKAIMNRVIALPVIVTRKGQAILDNAGIQQVVRLDGNVVLFGNRAPSVSGIYEMIHVRRIQSSYIRFFMEARAFLEILYQPNQPDTVEQVLMFLRAFGEEEYRKKVYTNFLTFSDTVYTNAIPNSNSTASKKDVILSIVNGVLHLQYSYLPTGVVEKLKISVGPDQITTAFTSAA